MSTAEELRDGDVVRYQPDQYHCREGMAIAREQPGGDVWLVDTYWSHGSENVIVEPDEVELLFNLSDFVPLGQPHTWKRFRPEDRGEVTHQHGLQRDLYVRKGAVEDRETVIQNARDDLAKAQESVESAEFYRDGCQRVLEAYLRGDL